MTHEKGPALSSEAFPELHPVLGANTTTDQNAERLSETLRIVAKLGWKIFPLHSIARGNCTCQKGSDCGSPGKHPRLRNGVHGASSDPGTVTAWWTQWPDANWGVATGAASGFFVIDVDAKNDGFASIADLDLPQTLEVLTGGGGKHYYYAMPKDGESVRNSVGWRPGVDIRGDGGYVVLPGSKHAKGSRYAWRDQNAGIIDAPLAIIDSVRAGSTSNSATEDLSDTATILDGIPEGQRDDTLFRFACRLRRQHASDGDGGRSAVQLLVLEAARNSTPPFPREEALRKIEQAFKQDHSELDVDLDLSGLRAATEDKRPRLVTGGSFIFDQPDTVPSVWGDGDSVLWAEGEGLMIAGQQGLGKTTIAQQLVLSRIGVRDPSFLGYSVARTKGRVLYLAMDRPQQAARSFRRMVSEEDKQLLDERLSLWLGPLDVDALERGALLKFVRAVVPDVDTVVIDSAKDMAAGLSDDKVGAGLNMAWQSLIADGIELLILHHERKAGGDSKRTSQLDDIYGSTWLTSGLGSVMTLTGLPGDAAVTLHHRKQPVEDLGSLKIYHDHSTGTTDFNLGEKAITLADFEVGVLTTVKELMAALDISESREKTIKRQLDALVESTISVAVMDPAGYLEKIPGKPNRYVRKTG